MERPESAGIFRSPAIFGILTAVCLIVAVAGAASTYAHHYSDFGITGPYADSVVGATTTFVTLEAENGIIGGGATIRKLQTIPANALSSPELEASGRSFVQLAGTGQFVAWVNQVDSDNTINIRECIPDAPNGGGINATLDLYINGVFRQAVPLTSTQTWVYDGNNGNNNGMSQTPSTGGPHVFYDEARVLIQGQAMSVGDTVMLKQDAANTAAFYYIDCIDLESATPRARPANSLSVADYGAAGNNTTDVTSAFNSCCNAARSQHKPVWIPVGKYYVTSFNLASLTIAGAGMWFTTIYITSGQLQENSDTLRDFCLDAPTIVRDQGIGGVNAAGNNYLIERVWSIHSSTAGYWCSGNYGTVHSCRSSMCWGDGLNMNNGNSGNHGNNLLAENNFTRGCGDDGATIYSDGSSIEVVNAALRYNTTVGMFWANGLRIAGGKNIRAENNLLLDDVKEAGLYIGVFGSIGNNLDSSVISGNVIVRCGGRRDPAGMAINASPGGKMLNVTITNNTIKDAQFYGILIGSDRENLTFNNNVIDHPAQTAMWIQGGSQGSASVDSMRLINRIGGQLAYKNDAGSAFPVTWGKHNIGIPDTLPVAVNVPVQVPEKNADIAVSQSSGALLIRYVAAVENSRSEVSLYNLSGRMVESFGKNSLHKGENTLVCPLDNVGAGVFIVKVSASSPGEKERAIKAETVVVGHWR